jgi:glycosyltransferase involved in cell wall biosynthesis
MRIMHVNFARGFRGGERQTLNLIEGLAAQGVKQTLVCRGASELKRRAAEQGLSVHAVCHPLLGHVSAPEADIIHVHEARGAYWAAIEHALHQTPYVITRRIPNPISNSWITGSVYRHAQQLLGVSQDVSSRLSSQTGRPVRTILSATTTHAAHSQAVREIRQKLGGGPIIGHVGALHDHHKGQSVLIQAFKRFSCDFPQARLLLVGEGPDRAEFEALAAGDNRIHFAGLQQEIGSWIAAMDVFCFPSREEGLGSSVLDAMALRIPVVTSNVGGLPELIGNNLRGLAVDNHDPANWAQTMRRILMDSALKQRVTDAAYQFASENGIGAMTKSYMTLYDSIMMQRYSGAVHAEHVVGTRH